jgi:hypothetical protein
MDKAKKVKDPLKAEAVKNVVGNSDVRKEGGKSTKKK